MVQNYAFSHLVNFNLNFWVFVSNFRNNKRKGIQWLNRYAMNFNFILDVFRNVIIPKGYKHCVIWFYAKNLKGLSLHLQYSFCSFNIPHGKKSTNLKLEHFFSYYIQNLKQSQRWKVFAISLLSEVHSFLLGIYLNSIVFFL